MPQQVRLPIGEIPFRFFAEALCRDEKFILDMKQMLRIPSDKVNDIRDRLNKFSGFLDRQHVIEEVGYVLPDKEEARDVATTIARINGLLRKANEPFAKCVENLKSILKNTEAIGTEDERTKIADRLELLVAPEGFDRQFKAMQLASVTGTVLNDSQIICDVRPVFDAERKNIDGVVIVTTLRLSLGGEADTLNIDVRLTVDQLRDLAEKTAAAQVKVLAIKELLAQKQMMVAGGSNDE